MKGASIAAVTVAFLLLLPTFGHTQSNGQSVADAAATGAAQQDLAKASQNPIADLISLPLQSNTNFGIGRFNRTQEILNIQPVIPVTLDKDWLLIGRFILPIVGQPKVDQRDGTTWGLGDFNPTFFFAPSSSLTGLPSSITVGFGPVFLFPTSSSKRTGTKKYGLGPSAVVVWTPGKWVVGALANNIWSYGGDPSRAAINQFLVQPFINYNFGDGWFLVTAPFITANWEASRKNRWTLPIGGGFGRVFKLGRQSVSASAQAYYNTIKPSGSADWSLRIVFSLLFPKKR